MTPKETFVTGPLIGLCYAYAATVEAIQGAYVFDNAFLVSLCGVGSILGAILAVTIREPKNPTTRKIGIQWLANFASAFGVSPFLIEVAANRFDINITPATVVFISLVMGVFAWFLMVVIFKIVNGMTWENTRDFILRFLGK